MQTTEKLAKAICHAELVCLNDCAATTTCKGWMVFTPTAEAVQEATGLEVNPAGTMAALLECVELAINDELPDTAQHGPGAMVLRALRRAAPKPPTWHCKMCDKGRTCLAHTICSPKGCAEAPHKPAEWLPIAQR